MLLALYLDGQGFVREHKSRIKTSRDNTDYALQLLDVNKNYTTLDFVLVSII